MDVSEQHIMFHSLISFPYYSILFPYIQSPILFPSILLYSLYSIDSYSIDSYSIPFILLPYILSHSILLYSLVFPSFHKKISGRRIPGIKAGAGDESREMKKRTDSREGLGAGAVGM